MGDPAIERLAGRPPVASLFGLAIRLGVVAAVTRLGVFIASAPKKTLEPGDNVFWFRVAMLAAVAVLAVWCLLGAIRWIRRWLAGAGVWIEGDQLRLRVPAPVGSWNPGLPMQERTVPLTSVQAIEHGAGDDAAAVIKLGDGEVVIPSGTFAIGGYDLDATIRARIQAAGGALSPEPATAIWRASALIRLIMIPASLASFATSFALIIATHDSGTPRVFFLPFVLGIAFLIMPFVYRGAVVIDRRGVFHQRSGRLTHLPWSVLAACKIDVSSQLPGWSTMAIKQGRRSWLHLTRLFGLGFPLKRIAEALRVGGPAR